MSAIFGGSSKPKKPAATGLTIQTSSNAVPVPVCWGLGKIAPNIIWYDGFKAKKTKAGGGKGGRTPKIYTYSADMILALCEGPVDVIDGGIKSVWQNGNAKSLWTRFIVQNSATEFSGSYTQIPWSYLTTKYPAAALAYRGIAYIGIINYQLGDQPNVPQHNFEIRALLYNTGVGGTVPDADPALLVQDFLLNPNYGTPFPPSSLDLVSLLSGVNAPTTGDNHYQTYCQAMGFALSPFLYEAQAANETLEHWLQITNSACVWSGSKLKFVPYGDEEVTANGVTYLPDNPVRYNLTDHDFLYEENEDPVQVERGDPADAKNSFYVEVESRDAGYELKPVPAKDQASIEAYGLKQADMISAHEVKTIEMGAKIAHLALQRSAYIRNTYRFMLPQTFIRLESMDIVTITQSTLSMVNFPVRVVDIEEDEEGNLSINAEDFPSGVSAVSSVATQPTTGTPLNAAVDPGDVTLTEIVEVPADLTNGVPQIWLAATGDPANYWGGCEVWISTDDASYFQVGSIDNSCRIGVLSANLPAYGGVNPDNTNTASGNFAGSESEFDSVSPIEAASYATLMYCGTEFFAYETATLTSTFNYNFTTLYRKLYGSAATLHTSGTKVTRLDDEVFKFNLPEEYVGQLLYVKFLSYNQWGGETQSLADVTPVTFTPTGIAWTLAPPTSVTITPQPTSLPGGSVSIALKIDWVASPAQLIDRYEIDVEVNGSGNWVPAPSASAGATTTTFATSVLASTNYRARVRAVRSSGYQVNSTYATSASTSSGGVASAAPNVPTGLVATAGASSAFLSWVAPAAGAVVQSYKIFAVNNHSGAFGTAVVVGTVGGGTTTFLHGGLANAALWRYWVVASNSAGDSSPVGPQDITTNSAAASLTVQMAGSPIATAVSVLNFASGATVTTPGAGQADVAISGGGGGGTDTVAAEIAKAGQVATATAAAFVGNAFSPEQDITVYRLGCYLTATTNGAVYTCCILEVNGSHVVQAVTATAASFTNTGTAAKSLVFTLTAPATLVVGKRYLIMFGRTDATNTTATSFSAGNSADALNYNAPGQVDAAYYGLANVAPAVSQTAAQTGSAYRYTHVMFWTLGSTASTDPISPFWGIAPTPPTISGFTAIRGAAYGTETNTTRGFRLTTTMAAATIRNTFFYVATPGATWVATALFQWDGPQAPFHSIGIAVRDNATDRYHNFGTFAPSAGHTGVALINRWSAINNFNANDTSGDPIGTLPTPVWIRLTLDATNLTISYSKDGENFSVGATIGKNAYVASIDQVGIFYSTNPNASPNIVDQHLHVMSWSVV